MGVWCSDKVLNVFSAEEMLYFKFDYYVDEGVEKNKLK